MSSGEKEQKRITRREFVKGAAIGAAGVAAAGALAGCAPEAPAPTPVVIKETVEVPVEVIKEVEVKPWLPDKWDYEADVVVVGYGGAGSAAAITAYDAGAKALLLEKMPEGLEGGNTRVSGNYTFVPTPVDKAVAYQAAMNSFCTVPEDVIRAWAVEMGKNPDWVSSLGGDPVVVERTAEFTQYPGADCVHGMTNHGIMGMESLWKLLKASVDERGIEVLYGTPGKELIQDGATGEILGVIAERGGMDIFIKAKKAVVLTCGGFENNPEMLANYNHLYNTCTRGTPYNTGDGIRMAQAVGADLWHMANTIVYLGFKPPEYDFGLKITMPSNSFIYIGADDKRFINEKWPGTTHGKFEWHGHWFCFKQVPLPVHGIFDENARLANPVNRDRSGYSPWAWDFIIGGYEWSIDNSVEIAKGWITKADTIRELATKIGRDPDAVEETVRKYNEYCAAGVDPELGRPAERLEPIAKPPFYAIEARPQILNSQGGPRRNAKAQIVRPNGSPIPRLYEAGELGSVYSFNYQGGGNVGECMAFGRIAAKHAVALEPWD